MTAKGIKERVYLLFYNKIQCVMLGKLVLCMTLRYGMVRVVMNFSCIHFNKNGCFDDGTMNHRKFFILNYACE